MPDSTVVREKRELRVAMRARSIVGSAAASSAVTRAVVASVAFSEASRVAVYAALPGEVPTRALFDAVLGAAKTALFPRCVGDTLEFVAVSRWDALVEGAFGTLEPRASSPAERLEGSDLVVVPGLAFDRRGGRLGRGRGYYDRALAVDGVPFLCGLAYAAQVVERVPLAAHDIKMDAIVTENGWASAAGTTVRESGGA